MTLTFTGGVLVGQSNDNATARETATVSRSVTAKPDAGKSAPSKPSSAGVQLASAAAEPVVLIATPPVPLPPRRPFYQIAESRPSNMPPAQQATAPIQVAALSPNQIVNLRGLWESLDAAGKSAADTNAFAVSSARRLSASREANASIGPFPKDRIPPEMALAYAPENDGAKQTSARMTPAAVTQKGSTSVASKPSAIAKSRSRPASERLDDPWLRGLVLATSLQNSLVVTQVGDPDFTALTQFMTKPGSALLMTFSGDPYLGMNADEFSGSAVVFPATVTFGSRHTASLQ